MKGALDMQTTLPKRVSVFAPSLQAIRQCAELGLLIKFHHSDGPIECAIDTQLKSEPAREGDLCHVCPGTVPGEVWCEVCGLSCCNMHVESKLFMNMAERHRVCSACRMQLKKTGCLWPTHVELFGHWHLDDSNQYQANFEDFYLA
jgi:hypothetical protein